MMKSNRGLALGLCFGLLILGGCADRKNISPMPSISDESRTAMSKPVNCNTAKRDIATLENEKASVGKQVLAGVRSVMPIAAVAGILMGDYRDRTSVAIGQYNEDIEKKIRQIRVQCNVP